MTHIESTLARVENFTSIVKMLIGSVERQPGGWSKVITSDVEGIAIIGPSLLSDVRGILIDCQKREQVVRESWWHRLVLGWRPGVPRNRDA